MILFLYGPDTFRSQEKLREMKEKFIREVDPSGLNLHSIDAGNLDVEALENTLLAAPFLVKKRMVVIKNFLTAKHQDKTLKKILDILNANTASDTIIVFWEGALDEKKIKGNIIYKKLVKEQYKYAFNELRPEQVEKWIREKAEKNGNGISPTAAALLASVVGNDLWRANSELQKLIAYADKKKIEESDVQEMCQTASEESIFLLTDAIGQKNTPRALALLRNQLSSGVSEIEILNTMLWHFKNLIVVKSAETTLGTANNFEIAKAAGLHPFVAKKTLLQARNFQAEELKSIYRGLTALDGKIKTGRASASAFFDLLIVKK